MQADAAAPDERPWVVRVCDPPRGAARGRPRRGTLKKYLTLLGIVPICFHIGTRSLYISREAMAQVKQLKQYPALLAQVPSSVIPQGSSQRKDTSDGC